MLVHVNFTDKPGIDCRHPYASENIDMEKITIATLSNDGSLRYARIAKDVYLKVANMCFTMTMINNQRVRARRFRYNRMIYNSVR